MRAISFPIRWRRCRNARPPSRNGVSSATHFAASTNAGRRFWSFPAPFLSPGAQAICDVLSGAIRIFRSERRRADACRQLIFRWRGARQAHESLLEGCRSLPCWFEGKAAMAINLVSLVSQFLTPQLIGGSGARARHQRSGGAEGCRCSDPDNPRFAWHGGGRARRRSEGVRRDLQFRPGYSDQAHAGASGGNTRFLNEGGYAPERPTRRRRSREPGGRAEPVFRRSAARDADAARHGRRKRRSAQSASRTLRTGRTLRQFFRCSTVRRTPSPPRSRLNSRRVLGASGLLAGLGGLGAAAAGATQTATSTVSSAATTASSTASSAAARKR